MKFIEIALFLLIVAGAIGLLVAFYSFLKAVYVKIHNVTHYVLWPGKTLVDKVWDRFEKPATGKTDQMLEQWGGLNGVLVVSSMFVITVTIFLVYGLSSPDLQTFFDDEFLLSMPVMSFGTVIITMMGEGGFIGEALVEIAVTGVLLLYLNRKFQDLSLPVLVLYNIVFTAFSGMIGLLLPTELLLIPLAVLSFCVSLFQLDFWEATVGISILNEILFVLGCILALAVMAVVIYLLVVILSLAIRELFASLVFSIPTCLLFAMITSAFPTFADGVWNTVLMYTLVLGGVVGYEYWRLEYLEDELDLD